MQEVSSTVENPVAQVAPPVAQESSPAPDVNTVESPKESARATVEEPSLLSVKEEAPKDGNEAAKESETTDAKDSKPDEAQKPAEPEKKTEEAQSDEPAPLPVYEDWVIPENLKADKERVGKFNQILGEFQTLSKADQAKTQEFGQKLVNYHVEELKSALDSKMKADFQFWQNQQNEWKESFISDKEFGGNRLKTSIEAAHNVIRLYGGTPEQKKSLETALNNTGMGNNPDLTRLLSRVGIALSEGRPIAAIKPAPTVLSKIAKRYGSDN